MVRPVRGWRHDQPTDPALPAGDALAVQPIAAWCRCEVATPQTSRTACASTGAPNATVSSAQIDNVATKKSGCCRSEVDTSSRVSEWCTACSSQSARKRWLARCST